MAWDLDIFGDDEIPGELPGGGAHVTVKACVAYG
jgi:hypothetical protein